MSAPKLCLPSEGILVSRAGNEDQSHLRQKSLRATRARLGVAKPCIEYSREGGFRIAAQSAGSIETVCKPHLRESHDPCWGWAHLDERLIVNPGIRLGRDLRMGAARGEG